MTNLSIAVKFCDIYSLNKGIHFSYRLILAVLNIKVCSQVFGDTTAYVGLPFGSSSDVTQWASCIVGDVGTTFQEAVQWMSIRTKRSKSLQGTRGAA